MATPSRRNSGFETTETSGSCFQQRHNRFFAGTRKNGAAYRQDQGFGAFRKRTCNFSDHSPKLFETKVPVLFGGRSDANEHDIGVHDRLYRRTGGEAAGSDIVPNETTRAQARKTERFRSARL